MEIKAIGTVVSLNNGEEKLMITVRTPLSNENGVIGYYDYGACMYPQGQIDQKMFFFNEEDIDKVFYEGYIDENEEECRKYILDNTKSIKYPKFKVKQGT